MKKKLLAYLLVSSLFAFSQITDQKKQEESEKPIPEIKRQLEFVRNAGQWHPMVRYKAEIPYGKVYLENDAIHYDLCHPEDYNRIHQKMHDRQPMGDAEALMRKHSLRIRFPTVKYSPRIFEYGEKPYHFNYYLGNDPSKWATGIKPVSELLYKHVYPGVDLRIEGDDQLKYTWIVEHPTAERLNNLYVEVEGSDELSILNSQLKIKTSVGYIIEDQPYVTQWIEDALIKIRCEFKIVGQKVFYDFLDPVDSNTHLYIDPKLIFSTYSGSTGDNFGFTATYDSRGNLYAGGIVDASGSREYPVTSGAYNKNWNSGQARSPVNLRSDISISKYDSAGNNLLWATYLGGDDDDHPHSLVVDRNDELIVLGTTYSSNFPTSNGAYDRTYGGGNATDIVVCKFSTDGTQLLGSTYIGGNRHDGFIPEGNILRHNYADNFRGDVIPDDDNNIFVATCTMSDSLEIKDGIQPDKGISLDGFAFELNSDLSELLWSSYIGGSGMDALYSVKLDLNHIYFGGATTSSNFVYTDSAMQKTLNGNVDGVLLKFDKNNKSLKAATYWGTASYDQIYFIDLDDEGSVYATGQTEGSIQKTLGIYGSDSKGQFIFKTDSQFSKIIWQTSFGNTNGTPNLVPSAFLVDVCGHIYFSGWSVHSIEASQPGTDNMEFTFDAVQNTTDNQDFYIMVLDKDASNILYGTYFGGDSTGDHVDGGTSRFDKRGVIYQSVCSSCPSGNDIAVKTTEINDFPVTANSAFPINVSIRCSNASFKIDLQIKSAVVADFIAKPSLGCGPLNVQFTNRSILGDSLYWDFGDGEQSSEINPSHLYNEPGVYEVVLTVIDSNTCNVSDQYKRTVVVLDKGKAEFEADYNACSDVLEIVNLSEGAFNYHWDFGNGDSSLSEHPQYHYEESGTYTISLIINEQSFCADTFSQIVNVSRLGDHFLYLYNVFTPNSDGSNDCFRFDGLETVCHEIQWTVYNRWGEIVFQTTDPQACWNGQVHNRGQILPEAQYYYVLDLDKNGVSSQDLISGFIMLIR